VLGRFEPGFGGCRRDFDACSGLRRVGLRGRVLAGGAGQGAQVFEHGGETLAPRPVRRKAQGVAAGSVRGDRRSCDDSW